jgi:hypothetical protein
VPRAPYAPKFTPIEVQAVRIAPEPSSIQPSSLPSSELDSVPPDSSPTIEAREVSMPAPARRARRMVTLTLLDGTKVNLPARSSRPPKETDGPGPVSKPQKRDPDETGGALTARDLVAALRAIVHGADASDILGDDVRWEPLFAALLAVLLKKHLIADWEFVEEFRKI